MVTALDSGPRLEIRANTGGTATARDRLLPVPTYAPANMKIAIVHDWCPSFRGGERVLAELCAMFKGAEVFTLFDFLSKDIKDAYFRGVTFHTSLANRWPGVQKYYRALFGICPFLIEQFDVTGFDAVISSSAAFSRGIITRPDQPHLSYIHSPMRYAWDEQFSYLAQGRLGYGPKGLAFRYMLHRMRSWDVRTAHGPDVMLANSSYVRRRINRIYGRDAQVVFPPVSLNELTYSAEKDDYYITASFLAPYKRTDLVIEAFNAMPSHRLVVVGDGQQSAKLRALAGPNVEFAGFLPRRDYVEAVAKAKALVFAGCEDFGIALAEAQACGTPLIAFGRGGACDIVRPLGRAEQPTGILFREQTVAAVASAVQDFEMHRDLIRSDVCRDNGGRFSADRFRREVGEALRATVGLHGNAVLPRVA
jgi:glycosyltransferase involved in cell wall biosynthesis